MSEPDNFLSRWSRRKRAAAESKAESDTPAAVGGAAEDADAPAPVTARAPQTQGEAQDEKQAAAPAPAEVEFDVSSLPPLESIGADTDVRAFLKPGVPAALRHAALRRVWSADPAIRDFKGLQENDWDFNDPEAIPGFGKLGPDFDIRKMASSVFGEDRVAEEPQPATGQQPVHAAQQSDRDADANAAVESNAIGSGQVSSPAMEQELVQREENIAMQQDESANSSEQNKHRRHGGALPRVIPEY